MSNTQQYTGDFVLGITDGAVASEEASERQTAAIESFLRAEVLAMWQRDDLPLEDVLEKIEEMEKIGWEATLEWLGHCYLFESYRHVWDLTYVEQDIDARTDDFVLGMDIEEELMIEKAHERHEKTFRSLLTSHALASWKSGNYKLEKAFEVIEDMDEYGALGAWNCAAAGEELEQLLDLDELRNFEE